jgi:hypothetical protein
MKSLEIDDFNNFYVKFQNSPMATIESILNHKLTEELGKNQLNLPHHFNSLTLIFNQLGIEFLNKIMLCIATSNRSSFFPTKSKINLA